jgi:hypothetical protein
VLGTHYRIESSGDEASFSSESPCCQPGSGDIEFREIDASRC